jgi:hypothetical protein
MFRREGIRFVVALALLAVLMGPAGASAAGFDPAQRGQAQWFDLGDLWSRFEKWLSGLQGNRGGDTEKRGSSIDPDGIQGGEGGGT